MTSIIEGNILIAGLDGYSEGAERFRLWYSRDGVNYVSPSAFKYHKDWNDLMRVVDVVSEIYNQADAELYEKIEKSNLSILSYRICGPSIAAIHDGVVEFAKFYNLYLQEVPGTENNKNE